MHIGKTTFTVALSAVLLAGAAIASAEPGKDEPFPLARQKELAEQAGFRIVPGPDAAKDDQPPPDAGVAARRAGLVPFVRDYNLPIYPDSAVHKVELEAPAVVEAALGETEPLSLGVRALEDLKGLTAKVAAPGAPPRGIRVRIRQLEPAYVRAGGQRGKAARPFHLRLQPVAAMDLAKGANAQYWIEAAVATDAEPGEHRFEIALQAAGREALRVPMTVKVRPYALAAPDRWIGAFCATRIVPDVETARDWKDHGINGMLWFYSGLGWDPKLVDGKLALDLAETEKVIDALAAAGIDGAVTIALGNDRRGMLERDLMRLYDRQPAEKTSVGGKTATVARMDDQVINGAYKECVRQFNAFVKTKKGWPEITLLHYDEPTERLMPEAALRYRQIKEAAPNLRVYGVTMNRLRWARMLAPISDILVCNGDYEAIAELGRQQGKEVWGYTSATGITGLGGARFNMGLRLYRYDLKSHWFWCYDFFPGSPWNEFDADPGDADWVVAYPHRTPGRHVPTLAYEGLREAWDDMRYAATVRKLLADTAGPVHDQVAGEFDAFLKAIPAGRDLTALTQGQTDFYATLPDYQALTALRARLVAMIDKLRAVKAAS